MLFMCLFFSGHLSHLYAQKYNIGITAIPSYGFLLPHHTTVKHLVEHHAYGFELGISIQTNGKKEWHQAYLFPKIELLAFYGNFGNPNIIGHAFGLEGSLYLPYFKKNGWSFGNKLNVGIGYLTKRYDKLKNPKDNVIGSHFNCIVGLGFFLEKQFKQFAIGLETNMKHMSNGAYKLPNLGTNVFFLGINYTHYLNPLRLLDAAEIKSDGQPLRTWEFYTQISASAKEIYPTGGPRYGVIALNNYFHYKIKPKVILEGGVDLIYDGSTTATVKYESPNYKNLTAGAYFAYVLPIHHLQLLVGMGAYLYNPINTYGWVYHRFGARFRITKQLWANITIKSHWAKADYFEYGIAYQWN